MAAHYGTDSRAPNLHPGRLALELSGLALATVYLAVVDPRHAALAIPRCPIKLASGLDCPSCGGLRAVHDLLHGNLRRAVHDNLVLVMLSPLLVYLLYQHARAVRSGQTYEVPPKVAYALLMLASAWTVIRNVPWWPWKPDPEGI